MWLTKYLEVSLLVFFCTHRCCGRLAVIRLANLLSHHSRPILGEASAHMLPQWWQPGGGQTTCRLTEWRNARNAVRMERGHEHGESGEGMRQDNATLQEALRSVAQTSQEDALRNLFERLGATRTMAIGDRSILVHMLEYLMERPSPPEHGKPYDDRPCNLGFFSRRPRLGILTPQARRKHEKHG